MNRVILIGRVTFDDVRNDDVLCAGGGNDRLIGGRTW